MTRQINYTKIPDDFVRFYPMDGNGNDRAWNADATVTDATWSTANYSYVAEQLDWWSSTSFDYTSATYTESYLIKDWNLIQNSSEVSSTALSWTSWSSYWGLLLYNRTLSNSEQRSLKDYMNRRLGYVRPRDTVYSFPKYSLPNLEQGKVCEISRAKNASGNYIDQTWNWNDGTPGWWITEWTIWQNTTMSFDWTDDYVDFGWNLGLTSFPVSFSFYNKRANVGNFESLIAGWYNSGWSNYYAGVNIQYNNGQLIVQYWDGWPGNTDDRESYATDETITDNLRHKITIVLTEQSASGTNIYIDWKKCNVSYLSGTGGSVNWTDAVYTLARRTDDGGFIYSPTNLSQVEIRDRALSPAVVQQLYYSNYIQ